MPHADAALFPAQIDRSEGYELARQQLESLFEGQQNWVCNLANASSLLWAFFHSRPAPLNRVNWAGFYVRSDLFPIPVSKSTSTSKSSDNGNGTPTSSPPISLLLAPFAGLPACQSIALPGYNPGSHSHSSTLTSTSTSTSTSTQPQSQTKSSSLRPPGVCASAFLSNTTQLVPDVSQRPGHIACDAATQSEIVIPLRDRNGVVVGVLDVDCEEINGFDEVDRAGLEAIAALVGRGCEW